MKIIRIFPKKTNATPDDENVRINKPPELFDECDEVHISVAFSWDIPRAEQLYKAWSIVSKNVKIGGPAFNEKGGDFIGGLYLKKGYTPSPRSSALF